MNSGDLLSWKFSSKTKGTYKKARARYHHAKKNQTLTVEVSDPIAITEDELFNMREPGEDVSDYVDSDELDLKRM